MSIKTEDIETLIWLGLTERQARVYLTLLQIGSSGAESISKLSLVHRQEIYRVTSCLQEMGLVEIKVTSPTVFSPVPVKDALEILVNKKTGELDKVRNQTKSLIERYNHASLPAASANKPYFTIAGGNECLRKLQSALEESCASVKIACSLRRFCQGFTIHEDLVKNALKKKIDFQVVTERPNGESFPKWISQILLKPPPNFRLRIVREILPTAMALYDNTKLCVAIDAMSDLRTPQLWSNSESLIALSREYFENKWVRSELYQQESRIRNQ